MTNTAIADQIFDCMNDMLINYCALDILLQGHYINNDKNIFKEYAEQFGNDFFTKHYAEAKEYAKQIFCIAHSNTNYLPENTNAPGKVSELKTRITEILEKPELKQLCSAADKNKLDSLSAKAADYCSWPLSEQDSDGGSDDSTRVSGFHHDIELLRDYVLELRDMFS